MRFCIRRLHASRRPGRPSRLRAFTLVEILVAMVVTLIMLGIVVTIFGMIGQNVSYSRSTMEMTDRLRATKQRLQLDLAGITVPMLPPQNPDSGLGYFEYIEGPAGRMPPFTVSVADENGTMGPDTTVGDNDDIIMFTTQSASEPFVGRHMGNTVQSQVAEVVWFVRGTTLYRRQLLVKPDFNRTGAMPIPLTQLYPVPQSFYSISDISAHADGKGVVGYANLGPLTEAQDPLRIVANSLSDLTKRENRYAHIPVMGNRVGGSINNSPLFGWPFDARQYGWFPIPSVANQATIGRLGLPTLQECSSPLFPLPFGIASGGAGAPDTRSYPLTQLQLATPSGSEAFDAWDNPNPWTGAASVDPSTGQVIYYSSPVRVGEDVILTNVLSFDVKVWEPTAPIITDLISNPNDPSAKQWCPGDPCPGYGVAPPPATAIPPFTVAGFPSGFAAAVVNTANAVTPNWGVVSRGAYVDLNYAYNLFNDPSLSSKQTEINTVTASHFSGPGNSRSGLTGPMTFKDSGGTTYTVPNHYLPAVYDTYTTHYERDGIDQGNYTAFVGADEGTNGLDDNGNGLIDEEAEQETAPPYASPLRGIQIKIRCFDPDSKQIREVTIVQEFLPE